MRASLSHADLPDLQGVLVHGYGHLHTGCVLLCQVGTDRSKAARAHLGALGLTNVETARQAKGEAIEAARRKSFTNVAFTHTGLAALGVSPATLDSFPREFVEGMATDARGRLLGDVGPSHHDSWQWGGKTNPVHVALLLYAADASALAAHRAGVMGAAEAAGLRVVKMIETVTLPRRQEHFGFRDGIAQPVMKGSRDSSPYQGDEIAPGEILLGHQDEFGETSHVPGDNAFGRNGTYLVMRQLEQDVAGFWRFCRANAEDDADAIRLAAKMVGRWPSGAALARFPDKDPGPKEKVAHGVRAADDNAFQYSSDMAGARCPLGSHVRRSNPRDGFAQVPKDSLTMVARHRMIRRGRPYGQPLGGEAEPASYLKVLEDASRFGTDRGILFACFNASLERQFEFVQQQWCENPKLAGAVNGPDPLIGSQRAPCGPVGFTLQGKAGEPARRVLGIPRFVTVRGGAYLFLPSLRAVRGLGEG
jgi:Dyp-type peroxidase family